MNDLGDRIKESIWSGDLEGLQKQLLGRNVDWPIQGGWPPLLQACLAGRNLIVDYLLDQGAGANVDYELTTPLMAVCHSLSTDEEGLVSCAKSLMKHKIDLNAMDRFKSTALIQACIRGHEQLVSLLLEAKCDIDKADNDGLTALHAACMNNHPNIVRLIIEHGANKYIRDRRGRLPVDLAATKGLDDIVALLDEPSQQESKIEEAIYVRNKTSFEELLTELPCYDNPCGKGGFNNDVRILLSGMRLEQKGSLFVEKRISLSQFLNMKNKELRALGVRFSSHREKIITGNKRFIMHPWGPCSLPESDVNNKKALNLMDVVRSLANSVKHLHILWATSVFCYERVSVPTDAEGDRIEDIYQITLRAHRQTKALIKELQLIERFVEYVDKVDKVQSADLIVPIKCPKRSIAGKVALVSALFVFLLWKSKVINIWRK